MGKISLQSLGLHSLGLRSLIAKLCSLLFCFAFFSCSANKVNDKPLKKTVPTVRDTLFSLNGHEVYLAVPPSDKNIYPVVMAIHGSGREARSYKPNDAKSSLFYIRQRDLAINNGYLFVVVSNGSETWGTDKGIESLLRTYHYVLKSFNVEKKWILWATSAGGVSMARFIKQNPFVVKKAIGTFPVYDLADSYDRLESAKVAWQGSQNYELYSPSNFPEVFVNFPYLIFHGDKDTAVPVELHSSRLKAEVNQLGGNVVLNIVEGGHSTDNWNMYDDKEIAVFLGE